MSNEDILVNLETEAEESVEFEEVLETDEEEKSQCTDEKQVKKWLNVGASLLGVVCSILIIVVGSLCVKGVFVQGECNTGIEVSSGSTEYTFSYTYGGDAYTGMQNASADASNNAAVAARNVEKTNMLVREGLSGINSLKKDLFAIGGWIIISAGVISLCCFLCKTVKII